MWPPRCGVVQPIGDMAPGFALAAFGRRRLQRSACLKAAESVGDELAILPDGQGLVGYPVWLAKNYPQTFGTLLAATWRKPTLTPSAGFTPARALLRGISARPPAQL